MVRPNVWLRRAALSSSRGQALPLVAMMMVLITGTAALAVDAGFWRYQERLQQSAADSAAVAGAGELPYGAAGNYATAAATDATLNGYTHDGTNVKVIVNNPPQSGAYNGNANAVEVIVEKKQPAFFARALGINSQWVRTRSVAVLSSDGRDCIYGLSTTGTAVTINGATVFAPACGIISDSNMTVNGATVTARFIGYAGTGIDNGSSYPSGGAHPKHALAASDPCPTIAGCAYLKANPPHTGTCMTPTTYNGLSTATLFPGRYCVQVIINGCTDVVFQPGLYEFDAGITMNGVTHVSGSGVTMYNGSGQVIINGSTVNLTAPATGNTAGVLLYQNPADSMPFVANGSGGGYAGAVYFPSSQVTINGNFSNWLLVVGSTVTINGSGTNVPSSSFPGTGHAVLAE